MSLFRNISSMRIGCFLASLVLISILITTMKINYSEIDFESDHRTTLNSFYIALFLFSCQNNVPEIFQVSNYMKIKFDEFFKEVEKNSKHKMVKSLFISTFFCILFSILFGIFYDNKESFHEIEPKRSLGTMSIVN